MPVIESSDETLPVHDGDAVDQVQKVPGGPQAFRESHTCSKGSVLSTGLIEKALKKLQRCELKSITTNPSPSMSNNPKIKIWIVFTNSLT